MLEYAEGAATQSCVIRRYSDFEWLRASLEKELKGLLIPALPPTAMMGRFSPEFVEERRRALQLFLLRLMAHSIISRHAHVQVFLTGTDVALNAARSQASEKGLKKTKVGSSLMSFFTSSVQLVTQTLAPGKEHTKTEEDLACEKIQEYAVNLQHELGVLEQQVEAWLTKEKTLGKAWCDLGMSVSQVARAEGQGRPSASIGSEEGSVSIGSQSTRMGASDSASTVDYVPPPAASSSSSGSFVSFTETTLGLGGDAELSRLLSLLGQSSDQLSLLLSSKWSEEALEFREPLKDAQRTAAAVDAMLQGREKCMHEYHALLDTLDSARAKLITAQGTPGREGKLPALETCVAQAERDADAKRFELAQMSVAVRGEFQRAQAEKAAALSQIVKTFVKLQLEHSKKVTSTWQAVLAQVNAETTNPAAR